MLCAMGALLSKKKQEAPPTRRTHTPGYFYNCDLNNSSIKELRTIRTKSTEAFRTLGRDDAFITTELRPLDDGIRRREQGPDPIQ